MVVIVVAVFIHFIKCCLMCCELLLNIKVQYCMYVIPVLLPEQFFLQDVAVSLNQPLVEIIIRQNPKILQNPKKSCHFVSVYPRLREIRAKLWNEFNPQGSETTLVHIFIPLSRDNSLPDLFRCVRS